MIVDLKRGNVLTESDLPVAFCVNTQGFNDAGFAGQVSRNLWPELALIGPTELGRLLMHRADDGRKFYAMCVHSLEVVGEPGPLWEEAPRLIFDLVQEIKGLGYHADSAMWGFDPGYRLAVPLPGAGMAGRLSGADEMANLGALARADIAVEVWTL